MARLITVFWRDIPARVIAKRGRESVNVPLSGRFSAAIERAAMRAGKGSSDKYLEDWRRVPRNCGGAIESEARAEVERLEAEYGNERLERMVKSAGIDDP